MAKPRLKELIIAIHPNRPRRLPQRRETVLLVGDGGQQGPVSLVKGDAAAGHHPVQGGCQLIDGGPVGCRQASDDSGKRGDWAGNTAFDSGGRPNEATAGQGCLDARFGKVANEAAKKLPPAVTGAAI